MGTSPHFVSNLLLNTTHSIASRKCSIRAPFHHQALFQLNMHTRKGDWIVNVHLTPWARTFCVDTKIDLK